MECGVEVCGREEETNRICMIRNAEKESHEQVYMSKELFQKGSWLEKPVKTVMETLLLLDERDSQRILDLGCGVGRNAIPIAQHFAGGSCQIDCVDILPIAIEKLQENADRYAVSGAVKGILSAIETFPVAENCYDLIVAVSALEHIQDEERFADKLQEIWCGLREDGIVCLILNSSVREYDTVTDEELFPQFEVNLPTERLMELLRKTFPGELIVKKVCPQQYAIPRGDKIAKLTTNVVTWVIRKRNPA